ncbi:MAG: YraN family protein [Bacteroidales bacterium]|jgi:putative endonuclease
MKGRKRDTLSTGRMGETLAVNFLKKEGFRVFHTNWRTGHKELDIIAGKEDMVHFVEVRSRSKADIVSPAQTVGWSKQRLVMAAARAYMARYSIQAEAQFDVISIVFGPGGIEDPDYTLEYIPNAFTLLL